MRCGLSGSDQVIYLQQISMDSIDRQLRWFLKCLKEVLYFLHKIGNPQFIIIYYHTFNSPKMSFSRSGILPGTINATSDFADKFLVTNSGLLLHAEINGMNVDMVKFDSLPSRAEGYNRLINRRRGCKRVGRSFLWMASLEYFNSDRKKSYNWGNLRRTKKTVIFLS